MAPLPHLAAANRLLRAGQTSTCPCPRSYKPSKTTEQLFIQVLERTSRIWVLRRQKGGHKNIQLAAQQFPYDCTANAAWIGKGV